MASTRSSSPEGMADRIVDDNALGAILPQRRGASMIQSFSAPSPYTGSIPGSPPSSMHRPRPIYDAITLQDNDDESSKPSTIPNAKVHLWVVDRSRSSIPERKTRLFCEVLARWPHLSETEGGHASQLRRRDHDGVGAEPGPSSRTSQDQRRPSQPEEIDIWLPRAQGCPSPVVRKVFVDGFPAGYTQNDAGDSLCLHVRRPTPSDQRSRSQTIRQGDYFDGEDQYPVYDPQRQSQSCGFLELLVEYTALIWVTDNFSAQAQVALEKRHFPHTIFTMGSEWLTGKGQGPSTVPPSSLNAPLPIFSPDIISLSVAIHGVPAGIKILAQDFDIVEDHEQVPPKASTCPNATTRLQKFGVPSLTPMGVLLACQPAQTATPASQLPTSRLPSFNAALVVFIALVALIFQSQLETQRHLGAQLDSLQRRVEQLAMATDVDFSDGMWYSDALNNSIEPAPLRTRLPFRDRAATDILYQDTPPLAIQHHRPHNAVDVHSLPVTLFQWIAIQPLLAVQRSVQVVYRFFAGA